MRSAELSPKEREILELLVDGKRPQEIYDALRIATGTYSSHMKRARLKLGARTPLQAAVIFALSERE